MTTLSINNQYNGIEITFGSKPAQAIIDSLKGLGFRWHKVKKLWYAKQSAERLAFAESIAEEKAAPYSLFNSSDNDSRPASLWERCKVDGSRSTAAQQTQRP